MITSFDERRNIVKPTNFLEFAVNDLIEIAKNSISEQGCFTIALSGGSTPKAIYKALSTQSQALDWSKVLLFWSDERCVPKSNPESNYKMSMDAGLSLLPIPKGNIFPFPAEGDLNQQAELYDKLVHKHTQGTFDLMMLGMGEDGHTASLFPFTHGLECNDQLAIANYVPQLNCWRMSLTFLCINSSRNIRIYVQGKNKEATLKRVFNDAYDIDSLPIQAVGTPSHKALWVVE